MSSPGQGGELHPGQGGHKFYLCSELEKLISVNIIVHVGLSPIINPVNK